MSDPRPPRAGEDIRAVISVWITPGLIGVFTAIAGFTLSEMRSDIHTTAQAVATTSIRMERIDTQLTERAIADDTRRASTERRLDVLEAEIKQVGHSVQSIDRRTTALESKQ